MLWFVCAYRALAPSLSSRCNLGGTEFILRAKQTSLSTAVVCLIKNHSSPASTQITQTSAVGAMHYQAQTTTGSYNANASSSACVLGLFFVLVSNCCGI